VTVAFFWALSALAILSAITMVSLRNPVKSALALVVTMASIAGLYATLAAQALALIQILVYAGAITVLILFVLMVVDLDDVSLDKQGARPVSWVTGGLVGATLATAIATVMLSLTPARPIALPTAADGTEFGSLKAAGAVLMGQSAADGSFADGPLLFAFEVVSLLLLVAMVGAVVLAKRKL
jgi:NADH-quinone oxidoreductase subunit J